MPDVFMPRLSDTMTEGILSQWLKREGDTVRRGDVLAEIETDKATMELEAYDSGVLSRILVTPGTTVPIGQPIAVIGEPSDAASPTPTGTAPSAAAATTTAVAPPPVGGEPSTPVTSAVPATSAARPARPPASPLARALAREHGLDMADITGTGPGGRIVRADVRAAVAAHEQRRATPAAPSVPPGPRPTATAPPAPARVDGQVGADDTRVPLTSIRRITAERLTASATTTPHFYLTSVADAEALLAFRADLNGQLADTGTKVSVTDLLIRACAVTLRAHPQVNSSWGGDHLVRHAHVHVGCAVALDEGLIVPVIRDADRKGITEIATEAHALADRARAGRLVPEEFTGGTFTISNLGMFGIDHFTAVINPPEAAILAVGAARAEAVVRDGHLVAGTTMKLTLSIDHRVVDGATAAAFLRDLVTVLERPLRILA